ncbi:MAG: hypothetical protein ACOC3A_05780, partial [Thermodesulfobacteriota bacterium]
MKSDHFPVRIVPDIGGIRNVGAEKGLSKIEGLTSGFDGDLIRGDDLSMIIIGAQGHMGAAECGIGKNKGGSALLFESRQYPRCRIGFNGADPEHLIPVGGSDQFHSGDCLFGAGIKVFGFHL